MVLPHGLDRDLSFLHRLDRIGRSKRGLYGCDIRHPEVNSSPPYLEPVLDSLLASWRIYDEVYFLLMDKVNDVWRALTHLVYDIYLYALL